MIKKCDPNLSSEFKFSSDKFSFWVGLWFLKKLGLNIIQEHSRYVFSLVQVNINLKGKFANSENNNFFLLCYLVFTKLQILGVKQSKASPDVQNDFKNELGIFSCCVMPTLFMSAPHLCHHLLLDLHQKSQDIWAAATASTTATTAKANIHLHCTRIHFEWFGRNAPQRSASILWICCP